MERINFNEAVARIVARDARFDADAYAFLRDALDFTVKERKRAAAGENRHVSGGELVEGFRQYALREFGPVARMVLQNWGLSGCEDIGAMVFHLIDERVFGKNDSDSPEDFAGHFTFTEAFEEPFQARPPGPVDTRS